MTPLFQEAIEGVYDAFRDVPRPTSIDGCPCCIEEKKIGTLLSKPLRLLSPDDLTNYAASAFLTVGEVEDYLYFLPRILEILVSQRYWWPDPEVVTRAIYTAGFHSWTDSRQQALTRYFDETVNELLNKEGAGLEIDSWICALGRLHIDLSPYLAKILANETRLVEFYEVNSEDLADQWLPNGFWDCAPEEMKFVVDWFQSAETQKAINQYYETVAHRSDYQQ